MIYNTRKNTHTMPVRKNARKKAKPAKKRKPAAKKRKTTATKKVTVAKKTADRIRSKIKKLKVARAQLNLWIQNLRVRQLGGSLIGDAFDKVKNMIRKMHDFAKPIIRYLPPELQKYAQPVSATLTQLGLGNGGALRLAGQGIRKKKVFYI